MPAKDKKLDCVDLKDRLQEELRQERERIGEGEANRRFAVWVETSDDPLAAWWRAVRKARNSRAVGA